MSVSQPGPIPPVPEPFWHRSWRTLFRWRPACIGRCGGRLFPNRDEWERHYLAEHLGWSAPASTRDGI